MGQRSDSPPRATLEHAIGGEGEEDEEEKGEGRKHILALLAITALVMAYSVLLTSQFEDRHKQLNHRLTVKGVCLG